MADLRTATGQGGRQGAGRGGLMGQSTEAAPPQTTRERLRRFRPRAREYRRRLRMRVEDWLIEINEGAVYESTWMGVTALKNPLDAWVYQEIVYETQPEVIVELGSAEGGSALFLAHVLELMAGPGIVVSVDVSRDGWAADHSRIVPITGRTGDPEVIAQVRSLCEGKRTMVIHDASHRAHAVYADLQVYADLVTPGCYLIVEHGVGDVLPRRKVGDDPGAGPFVAVRAFLGEGAPFHADARRERFLATNNPRGFLRRNG